MLRKISSKNLGKLYAKDEILSIINDRFGDVEMIQEWHGEIQGQCVFNYENKQIEIFYNVKGERDENDDIHYNFLSNYWLKVYEGSRLLNEQLFWVNR